MERMTCICGKILGVVPDDADDFVLGKEILEHCRINHKSVYEDIKRLIERHVDKEI
jgi:hypothetical protein